MTQLTNSWFMQIRSNGEHWTGPLVASWEVAYDPISDDDTTEDALAADLFGQWSRAFTQLYPTGLIPIFWYIESPGHAKFEAAPFQFDHLPHIPNREDFLTFYTWPQHAETGRRLRWAEIEVLDKLWRPGRGDKGGFIQEATGWKPAMLQPFVYLPSLTRGVANW